MRKVFLLLVLALLRSVFGNVTRIKNCDDCTPIFDCKIARDLIQKNESESNDQLLEAFCGFQINKLPKVCCSMLSNAQLTTPTSDSDSVEDHPNLRLLPANCSDTEPIRNLLGGYYAQLYEFPWIALISYRTRVGLQFRCSGSLINERYVLTAAHCIQPNIIGVRIGEFDIDNYSDCEGVPPYQRCEAHVQDVRVEESVAHPGYQFGPSFKNDIGLIRLKKPVDLTFKNARTICLPVTRALQDRNVSGLHATIAGWGFTEDGYVSSRLLTISVPINTQDNCSAAFNEHKRPEHTIDFTDKFCAGGYGRSTDNVDDGPLLVWGSHNGMERLIQHGVFSFGSRIRGVGVPTVYTDVSKYMKWILDTMKP